VIIDAAVRRKLTHARVGHFATSDGPRPSVIPVCFVLTAETVYQAIDAKPKQAEPLALRRVRNVVANPDSVLLVDHYEEDWRRLWWVILRGPSRLLEDGPEHRRALAALARKYPQYLEGWRLEPEALVIALDVQRLQHWRSSSPARSPGSHRAPGA
jgi:PPOX class probable F420-dependent enzyme